MTVYHHRSADQIARDVLEKWRSGLWLNNLISPSVTLAQSPNDFPSPDSDFEDETKNTRISFEFKPYTETKRGMMTGLGQAIAYLKKANASYLVSPSKIEGFDMEDFLKTTFNQFIKGKIPVGLIIYDGESLSNLRLACDIDTTIAKDIRKIALTRKPYWCFWRDSTPDLCLKLVISANNVLTNDNRSKAVWDYFWDNYYATSSTRSTINDVDSMVSKFNGVEKMIPFEEIKKQLRDEVRLNKLGLEETLIKLKVKGWGKEYKENKYKDEKKNWTTLLYHVGLWDGNKKLTRLGELFLKRNSSSLNENRNLLDEFAQIILVKGKHESLIIDIEKITNNLENIGSHKQYLKDLYDHFDNLGYIAKNSNRKTTGIRKFLQSEKQLWGHFSIIVKNGNTYFHPGKGYVFDWERIEQLVQAFYRNYSDLSSHLELSEDDLAVVNS